MAARRAFDLAAVFPSDATDPTRCLRDAVIIVVTVPSRPGIERTVRAIAMPP